MTTDRERFEDLFERCYDALMAYAVRRTASADDAADVVSETFTTAWRRVAELPPGDEARLWLYGTARRVVRNQRRGLRRREALDERLLLHARTAFAHVRAVDLHSPDGELLAALGELSETDQELLRLTAWEGLDGTEVARVLGVSPTAARVRLHRARARLRARWSRRSTTTGDGEGPSAPPRPVGTDSHPTPTGAVDHFVPVVGRGRGEATTRRTR
ncbi:RNA polymerase sigma factor [Aquipuribacter sp. SD81]|uniref:RNA polymerase sigma factor n=1 Tax=Aquipuribacter sp. SD81 TaxID=3127703 RepID=UPI00301AE931